ncbi:MAG: hypothetical protein K6E98_09615 [Lachnospiraceae bacterium]|nr:hypothetical protein [Lachnospiraceae bacterium]
MRIGAVGINPYIYNTNSVSSASLNKIKGIGSDVTSSKTDFSGLTGAGENENPLRMGETKNFVDIVEMQMQMGRLSAARVMDVSPFEKADEMSKVANNPGVSDLEMAGGQI